MAADRRKSPSPRPGSRSRRPEPPPARPTEPPARPEEPPAPAQQRSGQPAAPPCPFCGSARTEVMSLFGSHASLTACWCAECRSPFEFLRWRSERDV